MITGLKVRFICIIMMQPILRRASFYGSRFVSIITAMALNSGGWMRANRRCSPSDPDNVRFHLGNGLAVANAYPLLHERGIYQGMREAGESASSISAVLPGQAASAMVRRSGQVTSTAPLRRYKHRCVRA